MANLHVERNVKKKLKYRTKHLDLGFVGVH